MAHRVLQVAQAAPAVEVEVANDCRIACGPRWLTRSAGSPAALPTRRITRQTSAGSSRAPVSDANCHRAATSGNRQALTKFGQRCKCYPARRSPARRLVGARYPQARGMPSLTSSPVTQGDQIVTRAGQEDPVR